MSRTEWPYFEDAFLHRVSRQFQMRRKSLSNKGAFRVENGILLKAEESLAISLEVHGRRRVVLQLGDRNWGHLYVQSTWSRERGMVLLRLENLRLIDRPEKIVEAYERTVSELTGDSVVLSEVTPSVESLWRAVTLASVG